ncbi:MAG: hypothetical protein FWC16_09700 [Defluviitaleaceae bacterium]|nr:hypothetical protein [Defluviitaleaceae bacterium]MCL2275187.1 hypothetical protein [Defluviitaleaceae bacterium]
MRDKSDFYIAFYEQLAIYGFLAYVDFSKKRRADICLNGCCIAYFTKTDTIEPNPYAIGVEPNTIEKLREILSRTALTFRLENAQSNFTENELSMIHAGLVNLRIQPCANYSTEETTSIDALIAKIESIAPRLCDTSLANALAYEPSLHLSEGIEP